MPVFFVLLTLAFPRDGRSLATSLSTIPTLLMIGATAPLFTDGLWPITLISIVVGVEMVAGTVRYVGAYNERKGEYFFPETLRKRVRTYLYSLGAIPVLGAVWPELTGISDAVGWGASAILTIGFLLWATVLGDRCVAWAPGPDDNDLGSDVADAEGDIDWSMLSDDT